MFTTYMTYSKTEAFSQNQQQLAKVAKAMSHPARIAILQHLANVGSCISGDIANEIPLARATVSQHLQELKDAGLIQGTIDGQKICYCINPEGVSQLQAFVSAVSGFIPKACC